MSVDIAHVNALMEEATSAARRSADSIFQFQAACRRGDWNFAEYERNRIVGSTEVYLDRLMLVAKLIHTQ